MSALRYGMEIQIVRARMRSDRLIIVTCDGPDGCDAREEVTILTYVALADSDLDTFVTNELESRGWTKRGDADFCLNCSAEKP